MLIRLNTIFTASTALQKKVFNLATSFFRRWVNEALYFTVSRAGLKGIHYNSNFFLFIVPFRESQPTHCKGPGRAFCVEILLTSGKLRMYRGFLGHCRSPSFYKQKLSLARSSSVKSHSPLENVLSNCKFPLKISLYIMVCILYSSLHISYIWVNFLMVTFWAYLYGYTYILTVVYKPHFCIYACFCEYFHFIVFLCYVYNVSLCVYMFTCPCLVMTWPLQTNYLLECIHKLSDIWSMMINSASLRLGKFLTE